MVEQALKMMTVEEAHERLSAGSVRSRRVRVDELDLRLDGERTLSVAIGGDTFRAHGRSLLGALRQHTGVDSAALYELAEDGELSELVVAHSLAKRKGKELRIVTSGSDVLEVMPATTPWLPPTEVFELATQALGDHLLGLESIRVAKGHTTMRFVTGLADEPPTRRGDASHAGVMLRCNGSVDCFPYVVRLACSNGLLGEHREAGSVPETQQSVAEAVQGQFREALARSRVLLEDFVQLDSHPVENPATFLMQLARTSGLGDRNTRRLLDALATLPARPTRYDVVNLVTAQAHAKGEERFELLGAQAIEAFVLDACSHCARPV